MSYFKKQNQSNQNQVCSYGKNLNFCLELIIFLASKKIRDSLKNKHEYNLNFKWMKTHVFQKIIPR